MKQFLQAVAQGYLSRYKDMSCLTFVMPNKRSGSFLVKKLRDECGKTLLAPRVITISDFVFMSTDLIVDSRIDLLFRLYQCYTELTAERETTPFDKFLTWGETILSDFNEIDLHLVDAENVYKNVSDINELRANFLTPEQKRVMVEYFGYSPDMVEMDDERLWSKFSAFQSGGSEKFVSLWQMMYPLYEKFGAQLESEGLAYEGQAYRRVAESVMKGEEPLKGEKLIFVGFNALSLSEQKIFSSLKEMKVDVGNGEEPKADFIWDVVASFSQDEDDPAVKFVVQNSRTDMYPSPAWMSGFLQSVRPVGMTQVDVTGVPSNVMQVKVVGQRLNELTASVSADDIEDARIAVVLPDENLLLPLIYSLPVEFKDPNITMGFPLRQTPVISFAALLRGLQGRASNRKGAAVFMAQDVKNILSHPYARILFERDKISDVVKEIQQRHKIVVNFEELRELGEFSEELFMRLDDGAAPNTVTAYIRRVMIAVANRMKTAGSSFLQTSVEETYIATYLEAVNRLEQCFDAYPVQISATGVFMLADRLIGGETVAFEGKPLQGLQIMGVLETRCLDFDYVIMPSVNEKLMPRVGRTNTFIPNIIRCAYGLPPANYQEELFSYYFFRLIRRSHESFLTYDNRSTEKRSGGVSRYILQMKYLASDIQLNMHEAKFGITSHDNKIVRVEKNEEIIKRLERFIHGLDKEHPKKFSPSAINKYNQCQLMFLYNSVMDISIEREKDETIAAADMGTIIHDTMQHLYMGNSEADNGLLVNPLLWTPDSLRKLLANESLIRDTAKRMILKVHFRIQEDKSGERKLTGSARILLDNIVAYVKNIIRTDIRIGGFKLYGCEIEETMPYRLSDGRVVNVKMVIDRLDSVMRDGVERLRVVDYKTGNASMDAKNLNDVFSGSYSTEYIMQLLFYAEMFLIALEQDASRFRRIYKDDTETISDLQERLEIVVYKVPKLPDVNEGQLTPTFAKTKIRTMRELRDYEKEVGETYREVLDGTIGCILNPDLAFEGEVTQEGCRMCDYRLYCAVSSLQDGEKGLRN